MVQIAEQLVEIKLFPQPADVFPLFVIWNAKVAATKACAKERADRNTGVFRNRGQVFLTREPKPALPFADNLFGNANILRDGADRVVLLATPRAEAFAEGSRYL